MFRLLLGTALLVVSATTAVAAKPEINWPRWRGPNADGVADGQDLPRQWSRSENIAWSAELPGPTGKELYRERLGGNFNSSPIASDGRIFLSNNDGQTFVVAAGPKFKLLATNELGERITASPAISGGQMIYRTDSHLYCVGQEARK